MQDTLAQLPAIIAGLTSSSARLPAGLAGAVDRRSRITARITDLPALRDLLDRALADELPATCRRADYIRAGYDAEVDRLRGLTRDNKTWLSDLERQEQERTGIKSLKVRFNSVFGYYIEVTKANLHLVPADYIRRQTTVGGERYVTEALKQKEKEILHAEEKVVARELELFNDLVAAVIAEAAGARSRPPTRWPSSTCWPAGPSSPASGTTAGPNSTRARCSRSSTAAIPWWSRC